MSELDPTDRNLLELARETHEPTEGDRARIRGRVARRLGVGAGLGVASSLASQSSAAGIAGVAAPFTMLSKVVVGLAAVAVVGGGGWAVFRPAPPVVHASVPAVDAPPAPPRDAPTAVSPPLLAAAPPQATPVVEATPANARSSIASPIARALPTPTLEPELKLEPEPSASPVPEAVNPLPRSLSSPPQTLEEETRLVHEGMVALHQKRAADAIAAFDEHARRFPSGELAEERDAKRIEALCLLGRTSEARAAIGIFVETHPRSPLAARVRASCPTPSL